MGELLARERRPSRQRAILRSVPPCDLCPAAFLIAGADSQTTASLCRIDSTTRGQHDAGAGPVALVRPTTSPAAFFGYCLNGKLQRVVDLEHELGALATPEQRDIAERARNSGATLSYDECPSWRAEALNRRAARLAEQRGERRVHSAPVT